MTSVLVRKQEVKIQTEDLDLDEKNNVNRKINLNRNRLKSRGVELSGSG